MAAPPDSDRSDRSAPSVAAPVPPAGPGAAAAATSGWVRSPAFDAAFVGGTAVLALAAGAIASSDRRGFMLVLVANIWLLGYPHVVATWTRIGFDTESLARHRSLVFALPLAMLALASVLHATGVWLLATVYLHWQWFHYTRQSYGVEQIYWRRSGGDGGRRDAATRAVIYGVPLWGLVHRSAQAQPTFLDLEMVYLPVPVWLDHAVAAAALATIAWWLALRAAEAVRGELRVAHSLYVVSHVAVFVAGYIVIERMDPGWLLVNIWHNAQYLLVVWMFNANRFREGVDPRHRFLSTLSQPRHAVLYAAALVAISALFYRGAFAVIDALPVAAVSATLIFAQTVNFHHYAVDAVVWKLRRPGVSRTAGAVAG